MDKKNSESKIRVLLACCEIISELGLYEKLQRYDDIEIISTVEEINALLDLTKREKPEIILICYSILKEMGIDLVSTIRNYNKNIKFIVFGRSITPEQELMMIRKGISGIVSTKPALDALVDAVRKVYSGDYCIRREALNAIVESGLGLNIPNDSEGDKLQLTKREKEILGLISSGFSNLEISSHLFISETTVKSHISHIYKKMNIHNRLEAVMIAKKNNI